MLWVLVTLRLGRSESTTMIASAVTARKSRREGSLTLRLNIVPSNWKSDCITLQRIETIQYTRSDRAVQDLTLLPLV